MKGQPIALTMMLLALGGGAVAWFASFVLVLSLPRSPESGPAFSDIVGAYRADSDKTRFFQRESSVQPPQYETTSTIEEIAANELRRVLSAEKVVVTTQSFMFHDDGNRLDWTASFRNDRIKFPGMNVAVRQRGGGWLFLKSSQPLLTTWHFKILAGFIGCALFLIPLAWLAAQQISAPMRQLANWVGHASLDEPDPDFRSGPSELRKIRSALSDMRRRLRKEIDHRMFMLAAVAHDLRTPLTALRLRSERVTKPDREDMIADIARMDRMIGQFLDYARGIQSRLDEKIDFTMLVENAAGEAAARGFRVSHQHGAPILVRGDPVLLDRMVRNLIDNAVRFGGCAKMKSTSECGQARLIVEDEGDGLPLDEMEKVFDPFYRPDKSRTASSGGSGLGLAIVRMAARAHGGDVRLHSLTEGGLRAEVHIPFCVD